MLGKMTAGMNATARVLCVPSIVSGAVSVRRSRRPSPEPWFRQKIFHDVAIPTSLRQSHGTIGWFFVNTLRLRYAWLAVGAIYLLDAIWSQSVGLTLSGFAPFLMIMTVLLGTTTIVRWNGDNPALAIATEVAAPWLALANSTNDLSYLSATLALPLQDGPLANIDDALGFRWEVMFQCVSLHPFAGHILSTCYHSLSPELLVLGVWLSWGRKEQRIRDCFWIACSASLLTCIASAAVPAAGAFVHYGLPAQANWLQNLDSLRNGANLQFAAADMVGIVTFPSFHTVLAMLVIYTTRGTGVVGRLFAVWNVIMLFAIPPFGGHYLVDMIGGATVLAISIGLVRGSARLQRRRAPQLG